MNADKTTALPPDSRDNLDTNITYVSGNATVRSSSHRLRPSKTRGKDPGPKAEENKRLPSALRQKTIFPYNPEIHDLKREVMRILRLDTIRDHIGSWQSDEDYEKGLEYFSVMPRTLLKKNSLKPQAILSDIISSDEQFLILFDRFLLNVILPRLKQRLVECNVIPNEETEVSFYYQRPPTLRIQPGPSTQTVPTHCDSEYGHQDGEINFWMPLTDLNLTQTDLLVESFPKKKDYSPLNVQFGEVASFHGSSLYHYVPCNETKYTRVSLDFRVGLRGFFDPKWKMRGTLADHSRKEVIF